MMSAGLRDARGRLLLSTPDHGLHWDGVADFLTLRDELREIDVRYGQVHPAGLFADLEGELDHAVPGVDGIEAACEEPPARLRFGGRAPPVATRSGRGA